MGKLQESEKSSFGFIVFVSELSAWHLARKSRDMNLVSFSGFGSNILYTWSLSCCASAISQQMLVTSTCNSRQVCINYSGESAFI